VNGAFGLPKGNDRAAACFVDLLEKSNDWAERGGVDCGVFRGARDFSHWGIFRSTPKNPAASSRYRQ
jgi:hypothetical protein